MSNGAERARRLMAAAERLGTAAPAPRDLDMWAYLDVRRRDIAEHILWENRSALLAAFDALLPALGGEEEQTVGTQDVAAPQPSAPPPPAGPRQRYNALVEWRGLHSEAEVTALSDQDLARLASTDAVTRDEVVAAAPRLTAQAVVHRHATELSRVLGGGQESDPPPAPLEEAAPAAPATPAAVERLPEPESTELYPPFPPESVTRFAPYQWGTTPAVARGHVLADLDGDAVTMSWSPLPGEGVTLYRVVESSSTGPRGAPEVGGGQLLVTRATAGTLALRSSQAVSYLAVWANQGNTALEAAHAQPQLIGVSEIVWPPRIASAQVGSDRTVAALLTAPSGSRVEVQRFLKGEPVRYDTTREIDRAHVNTQGFRDLTPPMGEDLVYAAFCVGELSDGSSRVSVPATVEALVLPEVQQVQVQVRPSDTTPGAYDISWLRPPHGRVVLFATPERPPVGLEDEPRTAEIIEGQGLTAEYQVNYPPSDLGGVMMISGFAVDPSWVRAHFVAVHWVSDDALWVGPTVSMVTPHAPGYAQIVERVDAQVITFAWPEGVTVVQAHQGPRGMSVDPATSEPIAQLTRDEYVRTGGMRITRTLPPNGCAIDLFGVVYLDGRPIFSDPAPLDYPGITRLRYRVTPYGHDGAPAAPDAYPAGYRIHAEVDDELHGTPLAVVGNLTRLPLHPQDGRMLAQQVVSLPSGQQTYVMDVPAGQTPAYIRLFVNRPAAECGTVAVLDPPVHTLGVTV